MSRRLLLVLQQTLLVRVLGPNVIVQNAQALLLARVLRGMLLDAGKAPVALEPAYRSGKVVPQSWFCRLICCWWATRGRQEEKQ